MYEVIKNAINNTDFELKATIEKIDTLWIENKITEEQRKELIELAREKANPENSYAPLQEQIDSIYTEIDRIKNRIDILEGKEEPTEPEEPADEYPEYIQPTGAHNAYNIGDKITYNNKKYVCKINGCVWNPDVYPQGWEEVVEETEESEVQE